jgi:uncharacterized membrane protein YfcA
MKVTAQMAFWMSLVFGLICLAVGLNGLYQLRTITDEAIRADARGFAWFWLFLASIALLAGLLSGLMAKGKLGRLDS